MDDKRKNHPNPKRPLKKPHPTNTHRLCGENNGTNQWGDLGLAIKPRTIPEEQKGCRNRSRSTEELQYIYLHILKESKTR